MLRKMYLVTSDYLKEKPPAPQTKPVMSDKKTKREPRRQKQTQNPYDKWVKMRLHLEDEDVERKALIHKIGNFLQKVLSGSTTRAGQAPPPSETPDARARVFKSEPPDTASLAAITSFMSRAHESVFTSPAKRSLSEDGVEGASYVPGE
jgi:hypothetical protein